MNFDWHNEKRRIKDLVPYVANPRQITEKQAKDLKASLERFGVADPIIINTDNTIIGGHQRKKILETLMGVDPDYEIDVRVPDRELSIDEARELNVRLNKNVAEWNFDTLADCFDLEDLQDWGFEGFELGLYGDTPTLDELENEYGDTSEDDFWPVLKIKIPPETMRAWNEIKINLPGVEDSDKFSALMNRLEDEQ
jgi:hypothetical protein